MQNAPHDLLDYIHQHLQHGTPEHAVRSSLAQAGWAQEWIDHGFGTIYQHYNTQQTQATHQQQPNPHENSTNQTPANPVAPKKYRVFRALADATTAMRNNLATFVLTVIISYAVAGISLLLVLKLIVAIFIGQYGLFFASNTKILTLLLGSLVFYTIWYTLTDAFILTATSLALHDGATHQKRPLTGILATSFASFARVAKTNVLFVFACIWPVVFVVIVPIVLLSRSQVSNASFLVVPILMIIAIIWAYIAMFRFALAPYVALFEPNIPITKTLSRSKHLLTNGGQWFLLKGILLIIGIFIIIAGVTHSSLQEVANSNSLFIICLEIIIAILINSVLVMLYHNRKTIRG